MAESKIPLPYGTTTKETLSTDISSGSVTLVRCGKIRQLTFDDAKAPSSGVIAIPTLQNSDRPISITDALLKRTSDGGAALIWLRTNGTFGWSGVIASETYNGTLTWVTA